MGKKGVQQFLQVEQPRLAADQCHHVHAEHTLHGGVFEEIVQDHVGVFAAFHLDHHAHAALVGLVAQFADAFDLAVLDQLGDLFEQIGLVHLVRQFGDDNALTPALLVGLDRGARTDDHAPTAGAIGLADFVDAIKDAGSREVGRRHQLHQVVDAAVGLVDQRQAGIHHLGQVVRRDVGRHAHGDARGAVDQQIRHPGRHHQRFVLAAVVVRPEVDRLFLQVGQQFVCHPAHADFGVAHGRGGIAIDRAEVSLPVDQQVAHREILRHAHDGVVYRRIAVRVIFTDHVTDHARRLLVGLVPVVAEFVHGEQHAPVHWLQSVTHVRQRAAHDHAHGVIEVRFAHLVFEIDRNGLLGESFGGHRGDNFMITIVISGKHAGSRRRGF